MSHNDILDVTMAGLEVGFKVSHIAAFDLEVCAPEMSVENVLNDPGLMDFDHIPVREGSRIVGMLDRGPQKSTEIVRDSMHRLDGGMLVSAEQPLPKFLPTLVESPYRLVVQGTKIEGIVTISDIAKLPVRLLAFTSVSHLEAVITKAIRFDCPNDDKKWLSLMAGQRTGIENRLEERRRQNIHLLSPIEVAYLSEKITAISRLRRLTKLEADRKLITDFRNSLAHDGDFVVECKGISGLLDRLRLVEGWIDKLKCDGSGQDNTNV
jgi:CBS domain-containing protein